MTSNKIGERSVIAKWITFSTKKICKQVQYLYGSRDSNINTNWSTWLYRRCDIWFDSDNWMTDNTATWTVRRVHLIGHSPLVFFFLEQQIWAFGVQCYGIASMLFSAIIQLFNFSARKKHMHLHWTLFCTLFMYNTITGNVNPVFDKKNSSYRVACKCIWVVLLYKV